MKKDIYILGINESHGATAALLKNGEIIAAVSEERFTREKNQSGFPRKSVKFCLKHANIEAKDLTGVYFGYNHPISLMTKMRKPKQGYYSLLSYLSIYLQTFFNNTPSISYIIFLVRKHVYNYIFLNQVQKNHVRDTAIMLKIPSEKIKKVDHQTAHAFAAHYANADKQKRSLVITMDGSGDNVCSRIFSVNNDIWTKIDSTLNEFSPGLLYLYVTQYLGMKPNEHEYKVMGLAPYASKSQSEKVANIFRKIMHIENLHIRSSIPHTFMQTFLEQRLKDIRFDLIAGGIQLFTQDLLTKLVTIAIRRTGIKNIVLGGGVFMNVKANMLIANLPSVEKIFVMPCSTDESVAIGAAYFGYQITCEKNNIKFNPKFLSTVYLGTNYSKKEVSKTINKAYKKYKNFTVIRMKNRALEIARLIADGKIVARFAGRMEYGARALGNRSILARADNQNVIRIINEQIKSRDFWMPFAPVILKEKVHDYLINPKSIDSPFMMIAFETTPKARNELAAALHPYDYTARPQILTHNQNPEYYTIIKEFEKITGIGGVLNTSLNIHGEPIVCSPQDAIHTFQNSGLQYLAIEDFLLIKKNI